jgi:hypothetical protein
VSQQIITNDGGGGAYYGKIKSSTIDSVTLANDPNWGFVGTSNPSAIGISIIGGTGAGQFAALTGWKGRNLGIDHPWAILPDETSIAVITAIQRNYTIAHNTFTNTLGMTVDLWNCNDSIIEDNSGAGIQIAAHGPYGGPAAYPALMGTEVLRNIINAGRGDLISQSSRKPNGGGIGFSAIPGDLISGMLIRGNVITKLQNIYNANGDSGCIAQMIEQNNAKVSTSSYPCLTVQDNTP